MDLSNLKLGLRGSADLLVGTEHTAPRVGSGRVGVLATPVMINVIEAAALAAVEHLLPSGHQSLGIHLDIRHFAATPVGMRIVASCELIGVDGRTLLFKVEARDEEEPIVGGNHPLLKMPNVLCTPHLGWAEWDTFELYFRECFEQIVSYAAGKPLRLAS